jgi:hypothetical protein
MQPSRSQDLLADLQGGCGQHWEKVILVPRLAMLKLPCSLKSGIHDMKSKEDAKTFKE